LLQLVQRAVGEFKPSEAAWERNGGYVDPFRPTIEPEPMATQDEVETSRRHHLKCVANIFETADVFVFTMGLTEAWVSTGDGAALPVVPGVAGGTFDRSLYTFVNLSYTDVVKDMNGFFSRARQINPRMRFLLTVSPVPLMATATSQQVVVATMYSKSVLRAAAGFLAGKHAYVDYFPSYEIIASHVMRGQFYDPDMRSVSRYGVDHVMKQFFKEHEPPSGQRAGSGTAKAGEPESDADDVICDEELLAVFGDIAR